MCRSRAGLLFVIALKSHRHAHLTLADVTSRSMRVEVANWKNSTSPLAQSAHLKRRRIKLPKRENFASNVSPYRPSPGLLPKADRAQLAIAR